MAIIDQYRNILTVLIEFDVNPSECDSKIAFIKDFLNETVKNQPGFISANLHTSLDKAKIVNYAQWKSEEDFQKFIDKEGKVGSGKVLMEMNPRMVKMTVAFAS